ncbi:MAG: hypothetical protein Q9220_003139 [cf. Caloplaca sp. 1 TL-2023]
MSTSIVSAESALLLHEVGQDPLSRPGWIKIWAKSLSGSDDSEETFDLPSTLESIETLQFMGFDERTSAEIFARFQTSSAYSEATIISFAESHIRHSKNASLPEEDWFAAFTDMGLKPSLRGQIMDPRFADLRLCESAQHWALDTIEAKYVFLESVDELVASKANRRKKIALEARLGPKEPIAAAQKPGGNIANPIKKKGTPPAAVATSSKAA